MRMEDRIHWVPRFLTSLLVDVLLLASSDKLLGKSADIINKTTRKKCLNYRYNPCCLSRIPFNIAKNLKKNAIAIGINHDRIVIKVEANQTLIRIQNK